jgi:nucleotide-binding universal stress UspA family protein
MLYRSILVPLDGSSFAEHARPGACEIARRSGATLRLAHVHTLSATPIYVEGQPVIDEQLASLSQEHERIYLERLKHQLATLGPELNITVELLDRSLESIVSEPVGSFLAAYAAQTATDLIVMTTHGRGGLARFWLGSVADTLMRLSKVPILLLRPQEGAPAFAPLPVFQKILIPLDGSVLAEQIIEPALALGALMQAEYTLLRVVEPLFPVYNFIARAKELDEAAIEEARRYLKQVAQRLALEGRRLDTKVILSGETAHAILESAQHNGNNLIALATHGLSGLQRLMVGSIADKVLRGGRIPILLYRPQEERPVGGFVQRSDNRGEPNESIEARW